MVPDNPDLVADLVAAQLELGQHAEAKQQLLAGIEKFENHRIMHCQLAALLGSSEQPGVRDPESAIDHVEKALKLATDTRNHWKIHELRAMTQAANGNFEQAGKFLDVVANSYYRHTPAEPFRVDVKGYQQKQLRPWPLPGYFCNRFTPPVATDQPRKPLPVDNGLTAFWSFDTDTNESLGDGNTVDLGSPKLVEGLNRGALLLEGAGNWNVVKSSGMAPLDLNKPFSICFWIYRIERTSGSIVVLRDDAKRVCLTIEVRDGKIHDIFRKIWGRTTRDELPMDKWAHVVFTYDGTGTNHGVKTFVNGKMGHYGGGWLKKPIPQQIPFQTEIQFGAIGNFHAATDVLLDEVCIFNRKLTVEEMDQLRKHKPD